MPNLEFEDALDVAGLGKFQIGHFALNALMLASALLEMIDSAFILPAAACDLELEDSWKGFLTSMPNIGIAITAPFWGRFSDYYGRKPILLIGCSVAGLLGCLAAFMPNLLSYALCKFGLSLFLSPPSAITFAYCGELMTRKRRDIAIIMLSCCLSGSSVLTPLLAWLILPYSWRLELGLVTFRPWRLMALINAIPLLLCALILSDSVESPKFLVTKNKYKEALEVLAYVYSKNKGEPRTQYPIGSLKQEVHTENEPKEDRSLLALMKPPHVKWMILCCFLMFSVFCALNGIFLFAADTVNKLMNEEGFSGTICDILGLPVKETSGEICNDDISTSTFKIMVITTFIYMIIVTAITITPIPKKFLIIIGFSVTTFACMICVLSYNTLVSSMAMAGLQMTCIGIGPLSAYTVELFPTYLVGTAVSIVLMFGRIGAILGANFSATTLVKACSTTFYAYTALMAVSVFFSMLLPKTKPVPPPQPLVQSNPITKTLSTIHSELEIVLPKIFEPSKDIE